MTFMCDENMQQRSVKESKKLMKIVNTDEENLHIFRTTFGISIKFPRKVWLNNINIKSHKKSGLYPFSKKCSFRKTRGVGVQFTPP